MSRRRKENLFDVLFEMFLALPIWVGPIVSVICYVTLRWGVSRFLVSDHPVLKNVFKVYSGVSENLAMFGAGIVLFIWGIAELKKWQRRGRLDQQTGIESIRELNWREFEGLLGEAFRRQGYQVDELGGNQPDGGIDLKLRRTDEVILVQCKHWKAWKVGVQVVRELLGVVTSESAERGILVTSGSCSDDARSFAQRNRIEIIEGNDLVELIRDVRRRTAMRPPSNVEASETPAALSCPICQSEMVMRTAKKGSRAGSQFWGCRRYPKCQGTRPVVS